MKTEDLTRKYVIEGFEVDVTLGDTVWWFVEGYTGNVPCVATVTRLGDGMVTLRYIPAQGTVMREVMAVVPIGDKRLTNANVRKNGAWCTRALWSSLKVDK